MEFGIISGLIYYFRTPGSLWSAGGYWDSLRLNGYVHSVEAGRAITFLSACCWIMPIRLFVETRYLNKGLFLYLEDVEFCLRVQDCAKPLAVRTSIRLFHKVNSASKHMSHAHEYFSVRNRMLLYKDIYYRTNRVLIFIVHQFLTAFVDQTDRSVTSLRFSTAFGRQSITQDELFLKSRSFISRFEPSGTDG